MSTWKVKEEDVIGMMLTFYTQGQKLLVICLSKRKYFQRAFFRCTLFTFESGQSVFAQLNSRYVTSIKLFKLAYSMILIELKIKRKIISLGKNITIKWYCILAWPILGLCKPQKVFSLYLHQTHTIRRVQ